MGRGMAEIHSPVGRMVRSVVTDIYSVFCMPGITYTGSPFSSVTGISSSYFEKVVSFPLSGSYNGMVEDISLSPS
jgi:hypothetical protein